MPYENERGRNAAQVQGSFPSDVAKCRDVFRRFLWQYGYVGTYPQLLYLM